MSKLLSRVRAGKIRAPLRVLAYGPEGVGKTTFAADAPRPLFMAAEQGTYELDVARVTPRNWAEARGLAQELTVDKHEYGSLVVDTADWLDALAGAAVAQANRRRTPGQIPFGKGWDLVADEWRTFLLSLDVLRMKRGMPIVILAHADVKTWKNPDGEDFNRWAIATSHEKVAKVLRQWADVILFLGFETKVTRREGEMAKGAGSTRWIYTQRTASYDAKNRYNLPAKMALSWEELLRQIESNGGNTKAFRATIEAEAQHLPEPLRALAADLLKRAGEDARKLAQAQNWVHAKLDESQASPGEEAEAEGDDTTEGALEDMADQAVEEVAEAEANGALPEGTAAKVAGAVAKHRGVDPASQGPPRATPAEVGP